jgi:TRAP transporter TAXI family solute receptor
LTIHAPSPLPQNGGEGRGRGMWKKALGFITFAKLNRKKILMRRIFLFGFILVLFFTPLESPAINGGDSTDRISISYRKGGIKALSFLTGFTVSSSWAQKVVRLSIATGRTGGVYYPYGRAMAKVISKYLLDVEATAQVTTASVDNCKLIGAGKADLAFVMSDVGAEAFHGRRRFVEKVPIRSLAVLYTNHMHIVTLEGTGIEKVTDLKGKRVSTGAPGSRTEMKALRILKSYGLDPDKDMKRDKLSASESAEALKDRKIDAYFWDGSWPTASVTELAMTPGIKIKLIGHEDAVPKMISKYGNFYFKSTIPKGTYFGLEKDVIVAGVANLLICHEKMDEKLAYGIIRTLFDHKPELVELVREAQHLRLETVAVGSPIPFHPGAIRYFQEKGIQVN